MFRGIDNLFPIPIGWYKNEEGLTKTEKKFLIEDQEEKPNEGNTTSKFRRILHDKKCESLKQFVEESLENVISNVDAAVIVTGHDEFKKLQLSLFTKMRNPILIDTRGIVEPISAEQEKLIFRGLGRGKF